MASFAYEYRGCYDAIVLSGDLATTGSTADLDEVLALLWPATDGYLGSDGRPTLRAASKPILLIPGNHDRFGSTWAIYPPGNTRFDQVLGRHWSAGQDAQELWLCRKGQSTLVLIGADFTLRADELGEGPWGYLGQGRAYVEPISKLCQLTQNARKRDPDAIVLWVIHFDPTVENGSLRLLDKDNFRAAVQRERIAAVLCGHMHRNYDTLAGATVYVCGTTTQEYAPDGNFLNLIEIEVPAGSHAPTIRVLTFMLDAEREKQFVPVPP